jgi:hypothetical protein
VAPDGSGTSLDPMVFFSDAVFAIALTPLALDLKLPTGIPPEGLDAALIAALPQLLAYALSFLIIARTWMSHHSDFAGILRFNVNLGRLNLAGAFDLFGHDGPLVFQFFDSSSDARDDQLHGLRPGYVYRLLVKGLEHGVNEHARVLAAAVPGPTQQAPAAAARRPVGPSYFDEHFQNQGTGQYRAGKGPFQGKI